MSTTHIKRVKNDLKDLSENPLDDEGIFFWWDDDDITKIYLLIIGTPNTPYVGGNYLIRLTFGSSYPFQPPEGYFVTQDSRKSTRLHPNLYEGGKICLSILGTWEGPKWKPVLNLRFIALTLASLLGADPIVNEPSYNNHKSDNPSVILYNQIISYENIRVTVLDQLNRIKKGDKVLSHFAEQMKKSFLRNYENYLKQIDTLDEAGFEGQTRSSPCYGNNTTFKLKELRDELASMKTELEQEFPNLLADEAAKQAEQAEKRKAEEETKEATKKQAEAEAKEKAEEVAKEKKKKAEEMAKKSRERAKKAKEEAEKEKEEAKRVKAEAKRVKAEAKKAKADAKKAKAEEKEESTKAADTPAEDDNNNTTVQTDDTHQMCSIS